MKTPPNDLPHKPLRLIVLPAILFSLSKRSRKTGSRRCALIEAFQGSSCRSPSFWRYADTVQHRLQSIMPPAVAEAHAPCRAPRCYMVLPPPVSIFLKRPPLISALEDSARRPVGPCLSSPTALRSRRPTVICTFPIASLTVAPRTARRFSSIPWTQATAHSPKFRDLLSTYFHLPFRFRVWR